ncbi:MAG: hypothetical protein VB980_07390, partial [Opitutales bacterium]
MKIDRDTFAFPCCQSTHFSPKGKLIDDHGKKISVTRSEGQFADTERAVMKLFVPKETADGETRVAMTPDSARKLVDMGLELTLESSLGESAGHPDSAYVESGAIITTDAPRASREADLVARVRKPDGETIEQLGKGCLHLSFLDPFNEKDLIEQLASAGVSAVSLEMIPRTTLA